MTFRLVPEGDRVARPSAAWGERALGAVSAVEWTWCLDLLPPFSTLLEVAAGVTAAQQRPGEEAETGGPLLNLYLVVCALDQALTDHLHRGFLDLTPLGAGPALRAASSVQRAGLGRSRQLWRRGLLRRRHETSALAQALARQIVVHDRLPDRSARDAVSRLGRARWPVQLMRTRPAVPAQFRGADLRPADVQALASELSRTVGSKRAALLLVGTGPSGHYLSPLCAAGLDRLGHERVDVLSLRAGVPLLPAETRQARRTAADGGWALLVDGQPGALPPRMMAALMDLGFPAARVHAVDLSQLSRVRSIDAALANEAIEEWLNRPAMLQRLGADAAVVLRGDALGSATGTPDAGAEDGWRHGGHALKLVQVELRRGPERWIEDLLARGVGLGFFGYHSWLVAACLGDRIPEVLGINEGVLLMRWESGRPPDPFRPDELDDVAAYVAARARRLDLGARREPATASGWIAQVARLLTRQLGGAGPAAAVRVSDELSRHVRPARHAAVDGRMGPAEWLRSRHGLLKLDFEEHSFDVRGYRVTDPVHDIAAAVVGFRLEPDEERRLIDAYVRSSPDAADLDARVTLHKLLAGSTELSGMPTLAVDLHARAARVTYAREQVIRETLLSRTVNAYLAAVLLDREGSGGQGGTWMVDLDHVLESDAMGFECSSPAGMRALRTLLVHDQKVFVTSGRSLGEVRERCQTFGLAGGLAEHGAVAWDERRRKATVLLSADARRALNLLRKAMLEEPGVLVDPRYSHSLSLFRPVGTGRAGVDAAVVRAIIDRHGLSGLEVVEGARRTAVRPAGLDARVALRRLRGAEEDARAHMIEGLQPGPSGLQRAAQGELHGWTGSCRRCRQRPLRPADRALVQALALRDQGWVGRLAYVLRPGSLRAFEL